jgi:BMFP domain-containing protein YqiC
VLISGKPESSGLLRMTGSIYGLILRSAAKLRVSKDGHLQRRYRIAILSDKIPYSYDRPEATMTQTSSRIFDEMARLMNDAAGVATGVRREFDTLFKSQAERILRDLDVVKRDDFEAVKEMAKIAREENEALKARLAALEARLKATPTSDATPNVTPNERFHE